MDRDAIKDNYRMYNDECKTNGKVKDTNYIGKNMT